MNNQDIYFDDGVHQANFVDSLALLLNTARPDMEFIKTTLKDDFPSLSAPVVLDLFNDFLTTYNDANGRKFEDWNDFKTNWYNYMTFRGHPPATTTALYKGFLQGYIQASGNVISPDLTTISGDWSILTNPAIPPPITLDFTSDTNINNPFIKAFNQFIERYDYPFQGLGDNPTRLINQFEKFMTATALIQDPSQAIVPPGFPANFFAELPTYKAIYQAFGPANITDEEFISRVKQFYLDEVQTKGFFTPSQSFSSWVDTIRIENGYNAVRDVSANSSLAGNSSEKVIILNRIIVLLISIIKTLQDVGIAQANRLKFTTAYQQAYVALQTQVPTFVRGSPGAIGDSGESASQVRNDLNASYNSILIDNLRSLRGLQEDRAKKQQSDVNQTNDAVNQQTDMATTLLQQISTLLNTVLR